MKRIRPAFFLILLFGSISFLYRVLLLWRWKEPTSHLAFFNTIGVAYDLLVVCQLSLFALLLSLFIRRAFPLILSILSVAWVVFNFIDYTYFNEFRSHIPFSAVIYAGFDEWEYMRGSYLAVLQSWQFIVYCIIPVILSVIVIRFGKSLFQDRRGTIFINCLMLVIIALAAGTFANSHVENFVHPIQNNGLFYFLVRTPQKLDTTTPLPTPRRELEIWQTHEVKARRGKPLYFEYPFMRNTPQFPVNTLFRKSGLGDFFKEKQPNIIIIMSESFNADRIGTYNSDSDLTPNFDAIAKKGILFENFYSNSYQTMRGELAVLCSLFPNPGPAVFRFYHDSHFNCLPTILRNNGYSTSWIYPHSGNFDNQSFFLHKIGFDQIVTELDFNPALQRLSWGYGDHELMKKAIAVYRTQKEPFFSLILTTTNHHPHDVPDNYRPEKRDALKQNATVRYADYAIGRFFTLAEKETFFKNTVVLITSDTGFSLLDNGKNLNDPIGLPTERLPFLIYWPKAKSVIRISTLSSQVDIAPTITDLLGINGISHFVGQSLRRFYEQRMYVRSTESDLRIYSANISNENQNQGEISSGDEFKNSLKKIINYVYRNNRVWRAASPQNNIEDQ